MQQVGHFRALQRRLAGIGLHLALVAMAAIALLPFAWLLCGSIKTGDELFNSTFLPWRHLDRLTIGNFRSLFHQHPFGGWMVNSLFLASAHTVMTVALSAMGGFALAKYQFRGKTPLMLVMLATMLLPAQALMPASYELMYHLGWIDSYAALLVPSAVSVFGIFLFRQAMAGVSDELLQAGRMDGCSELRLWWEIALPIVRPMIGAYTLLSFAATWNSFLWPQVILHDESKFTLPMALANMVGLPEYQAQYGLLLAGTLISILPVAILFFALQGEFVAGLSSGAVKE